MTIGHTIRLAGLYLRSHFRRYVFLLVILSFSFAVITAITSLTEGMNGNVFRAAENHYGGHVFVAGWDEPKMRLTQGREMIAALAAAGFPFERALLRTVGHGEGVLYFAGSSVRQKDVIGVDWDAEREDFRRLPFSEGGAEFETLGDGIFISDSVARRLHARRGADLTLEVTTATGQKNTGKFIVQGIIQDSSVFGYYKCFIDRQRLNALFTFGPDECSWVGFFFTRADPASLSAQAERLAALLRGRFSVGPLLDSREAMAEEGRKPSATKRKPVITLTAYISQVSDLLAAMRMLSYFLYVMMIGIALASISVTYRLILRERSREIGTIRVMGLPSGGVQLLLIAECLMLFALALGLGFLLSQLIVWLLSLLPYSSIPGFEIFLSRGRLAAAYPPDLMLFNLAMLLAATVPAVWLPARKTSRAELVKVLSGEGG